MKPHVYTAHSHEILFTINTYLTFAFFFCLFFFRLINADCRNAAVRVELFTRPSLSRPTHTGRVWEPKNGDRESEIQQLKRQDMASTIQPQQLPVTAEKTQTATAVSLAQKDISKMTWREGKEKAPTEMERGAAVVHRNTAYFAPFNSATVYSYQNILGNKQFSRLPENPHYGFGLPVIDGLLTSVGGYNNILDKFNDNGPTVEYTSTLLSLTGEGERKQWSELFLSMPTSR